MICILSWRYIGLKNKLGTLTCNLLNLKISLPKKKSFFSLFTGGQIIQQPFQIHQAVSAPQNNVVSHSSKLGII